MTGQLSRQNRTTVHPDKRTGQPPPYRGVRPCPVRIVCVQCGVEFGGVMAMFNHPPELHGKVCMDCWLHGPPDLLGREVV